MIILIFVAKKGSYVADATTYTFSGNKSDADVYVKHELMFFIHAHAHAHHVGILGNSYTSYSSSGSGQPAGYSYSNANGSSYYNNGKVKIVLEKIFMNEEDYEEHEECKAR